MTYQWPSSVLSDNLFGLTWKRERCRRLRLLYNGTDVPLAWKGGPALLSFGPSHEETERGLPDGAGQERIFGQAKEMYVPTRCPHSLTRAPPDASCTGLLFLPSVSLTPSAVDILSSRSSERLRRTCTEHRSSRPQR